MALRRAAFSSDASGRDAWRAACRSRIESKSALDVLHERRPLLVGEQRAATGTEREASFTQTTGPWYFGSTLTAVWARLVVAPPMSSGTSKPLPLHLGGEVDHLVQRRGDQPGEPDDVGVLGHGGVEDLLRRHHDAEVDDLVVVALEDDADDVLADVVDVALDGRHDDLALGSSRDVAGLASRPRCTG